jgi:endo-1,4-beta-xylanase
MARVPSRALTLVVAVLLCVVASNAAAVAANGEVTDDGAGTPLRVLAHRRGIAIGTAARPEEIARNSPYRRVLGREFDMVTPENVMKWPTVHPLRGHYDFGPAEELMRFARRHHMRVRGHNLLTGGNNTADWVLNGKFSGPELASIVHEHISTVVRHFRGRIAEWDVVNEALDVAGNLDQNLWLQGLGPEYIASAFRWAHEADPHALLVYNEDDIACDPCNGDFPTGLQRHKQDAIYNLVAGLKRKGVPIGGVGIQMHLWATPPNPADVAAFMARLRGLGLQVSITEMDVRLPDTHTDADLIRQADVYRQILRTCIAAPNCKTFVTWGFSDAVSWVPVYLPGYGTADIFDTRYRPKPAYFALQRALSRSPEEREGP